MKNTEGEFFEEELMQEIKSRFALVDRDHLGRERLYFDNAGGSFRLKAAVDVFTQVDSIPDNPERIHAVAVHLQNIQSQGATDLRTILNVEGGSIYASLTASGAMFDMVRAIAENVPGTNMVTTALEHPSAFDAMVVYAKKLGKELRVAKSNPLTGGVDVNAVSDLVDSNTCLLNVIYASNISGAKLDIEGIVRAAREINPDLYIIVDAVQHAPHGLIDLKKTPIDGINIAPYKFFGCRGSGMAWLSGRASVLPHHKLAAKNKDFWDLGSSAPGQFAVLTEIVNYVCWLGGQFISSGSRRDLFACGIQRIELHERALLARLLNGCGDTPGLRKMANVQIFLDYEDLTKRDLILAIGIDSLGHAQAVREYEKRGVIVYERVSSSLYSKRMLESFGLEGAIRVSPLHCNSPADIDRFLQVTHEIAEIFASARAE
ncbi:MAG: aminotransferase class V-fold PLP-dependent enzyme [Burkholderiaceae bacterium]|nr:aminotransferase class V-fold PLP-dependent enzyme [Burkholderiaceae bacterium]